MSNDTTNNPMNDADIDALLMEVVNDTGDTVTKQTFAQLANRFYLVHREELLKLYVTHHRNTDLVVKDREFCIRMDLMEMDDEKKGGMQAAGMQPHDMFTRLLSEVKRDLKKKGLDIVRGEFVTGLLAAPKKTTEQ